MTQTGDTPDMVPEPREPPVTHRRGRFSLVWLVPGIAVLIGVSMLVHAWLSSGPEITVTFHTATGLEAGKTPVKYKDVTVGAVSAIALSADGAQVIVTLSLVKSALSLTREDTRFWVVRPRIGIGGVSGIDTLFSGAYIAVDTGTAQQTSTAFTGLETPPTVIGGMPGRSFTLHTDDLGSLDIGSPVYYRRIQVGRVAAYRLDVDGKSVGVEVFIDAPYDRFVTADTRFWNASGVDVSIGADGFKLKTQSVATIVAGGIAFATPESSQSEAASGSTSFVLAKDQATAMAPPDGPSQFVQLRFDQSLRGLTVGAPVEFSGLNIGQVISRDLDYDQNQHHFSSLVGIVVYPQRLGRVLEKLRMPAGDAEQRSAEFLRGMVEHGLRAEARSGNLLTGQLFISLEFVSDAPKVTFDVSARPLTLPTVNGSFDRLQEQVANIVAKVERLPLDAIGRHVDMALVDLDKTFLQVNSRVLPETARTLLQAGQTFGAAKDLLADDAPLQQKLGQTLQDVQRTARSLRVLTDLLGTHPESLLLGRPDDPAPAVPGSHKPVPAQEPLR
ncbi:MAG: MlaD family protein [Azospirillaceae bacterium]|nr:MlaD family protein [Azospirillaceae bacterium]